jgi:hypothetical protein
MALKCKAQGENDSSNGVVCYKRAKQVAWGLGFGLGLGLRWGREGRKSLQKSMMALHCNHMAIVLLYLGIPDMRLL